MKPGMLVKKTIEDIPIFSRDTPLVLEHIFNQSDKRFIILISGSERESLIKYITNSYPLHTTKCHVSDVFRIWRSFEMRQNTLKYVYLKPFTGDLSELPLLTWKKHPVNLEWSYQATFKYIIEDDGSLYFSNQLPRGSIMRIDSGQG